MLVLLSPAKDLNFAAHDVELQHSQPELLRETKSLASAAKKLKKGDIKRLMKVNDALAELTFQRFQNFKPPFSKENAKQAVLAFAGDAYRGLDAATLSADDLEWAQDHLRILSGFYGLLRPLDLIQPYRLEMGRAFKNERGKNLYEFWGETLTQSVNRALKKSGDATIVNLASKEYFSALSPDALKGDVITPHFKEVRDGTARPFQFFVKRARGLMTRFIIENRVDDPRQLKDFKAEGYKFTPKLSTDRDWVFTRPAPPKKN